METYHKEHCLRVHAHAFFRRGESKINFSGMEDLIPFCKINPILSERLGSSSKSLSASWVGAFYCQCPKIGQVFSAGSYEPFTGYPVNGDWVFHLVQQQKIEYEDAKSLIVRCGRGIQRRLQDLNTWKTAKGEMDARAYVDAAQKVHAETNLPKRDVETVEKWKADNTKPMMRRKKILVLAGPTGTGKTEYVKALFGCQNVLELNAAGMQHPCLRSFDPHTHSCILWDEAEAFLIAQNRKLFQCPASFVELGFSPTGNLTYTVMVNKAVMVVCSNRWDEQLADLPRGDRDWIKGNCVVVYVTEPLWVSATTSKEKDLEQSPSPASKTAVDSSQSPAPDTVVKATGCDSSSKLVYL